MYTKNKCAVKIGNKQIDFSQGRGVKQGCPISPTLFNIYIKQLEESEAPGITLHNIEIKCLLYADDLVLLYPTKEGLEQHRDRLHRFCQTWALTVNLKNNKYNDIRKKVGK
jgi:hypothetical protein